MIVEPIMSSPESKEYDLFVPGECTVVISFGTLPEVGLDNSSLFMVAQVLVKLYSFCSLLGKSVSSFISWNATVSRDPLKSNSVCFSKGL